jgi:hypothetical protein
MVAVARLVTLVDVEDDDADGPQLGSAVEQQPSAGWTRWAGPRSYPGQASVSARHEAVLADGRRLLLLGDRGWSWGSSSPDIDLWATTSVEEIESTARVVVGPDEPFDEHSQEDMEADHWAHLADVLRQHGVIVDPAELKRLPHDVVLGQRLLARIGRNPR